MLRLRACGAVSLWSGAVVANTLRAPALVPFSSRWCSDSAVSGLESWEDASGGISDALEMVRGVNDELRNLSEDAAKANELKTLQDSAYLKGLQLAQGTRDVASMKALFEERMERDIPTLEEFEKLVAVLVRFDLVVASEIILSAEDKWGITPETEQLIVAYRHLIKAGRSEEVLKMVEELDGDGYVRSVVHDALVMEKMRKDDAAGMVEMLDKTLPSATLIGVVLKYFSNTRAPYAAEYVFNGMRARGLTPRGEDICTLITAYATVNLHVDAMRFMALAAKEGVNPDLHTRRAILLMHVRLLRPSECLSTIEDMLRYGRKPETKDFNSTMGALIRKRYHEAALALYSRMRELEVSPNGATYSLIMRCCPFKAIPELFAMKEEAGHTMMREDYAALMRSYIHTDDVEKGMELIERGKRGEIPLHVELYDSIMGSFRSGAAAEAVMGDMVESGLQPTDNSFLFVLRAFIQEGNMDKAWSLYWKLFDAQMVDNGMICHLLDFVGREQTEDVYDRLRQIWDKIWEENMLINSNVFNSYLEALGRVGRGKEMLEVFHMMDQSPVHHVTKKTILTMLGAHQHMSHGDIGVADGFQRVFEHPAHSESKGAVRPEASKSPRHNVLPASTADRKDPKPLVTTEFVTGDRKTRLGMERDDEEYSVDR